MGGLAGGMRRRDQRLQQNQQQQVNTQAAANSQQGQATLTTARWPRASRDVATR
jgi:hypothetical protein